MKVVDAEFIECPTCEAKYQPAFPDDWTYTFIPNYEGAGWITAHRPGCPAGPKQVLVDG